MNASAVHPLHLTEQRVPGIRCFDQAAHGWRGVQAGGLAARSVTYRFKYASLPRGSVRPSCHATAGYPLRCYCNGWNATNRHE